MVKLSVKNLAFTIRRTCNVTVADSWFLDYNKV